MTYTLDFIYEKVDKHYELTQMRFHRFSLYTRLTEKLTTVNKKRHDVNFDVIHVQWAGNVGGYTEKNVLTICVAVK